MPSGGYGAIPAEVTRAALTLKRRISHPKERISAFIPACYTPGFRRRSQVRPRLAQSRADIAASLPVGAAGSPAARTRGLPSLLSSRFREQLLNHFYSQTTNRRFGHDF